jgi:hypothetical protein
MPADDINPAALSVATAKSPPPIPKAPTISMMRGRPVALDWVVPLVSVMVLAGFFGTMALLLMSNSIGALGDAKDVLFVLLGVLGAAFIQVVNYWLGSSKGSADQTSVLLQR